jgi:UDP-N-acetylmuramate dehydrogenase
MVMTAKADRRSKALYTRLKSEGRGKLLVDEPLAAFTTFRIGGPADLLYVPADKEDLALVAQICTELGETYFVMGGGSNILVRDGGLRGLVLHPAPALRRCWIVEKGETEGELASEAGVATSTLVATAARSGLGGLEFAVAIPGTVGGALKMNAGTPEGEIGDRIHEVEVLLRQGELKRLSYRECGFGYRKTTFPQGAIILEGRWRLPARPPAEVLDLTKRFTRKRLERQPVGEACAGSMFKNPRGNYAGRLIEAAGCKGLTMGRAQVSSKHANFFVNTGGATAADVEALIHEVHRRVEASGGVALELEIEVVGEPA